MRKLTIRLGAATLSAWAVLMAQAPTPPPAPGRIAEPLGETSETKVMLFELALPPGGSLPLRTHNSAAFAYVMEGEVERQTPNAPETLRAGTFFREAAGQPAQTLHNAGKGTAKVLVLQNSASLPKGVKPLLEYTLPDLRDLEVSFTAGLTNPGDPSPRPHIHPGPAFGYISKGEVLSQVEPGEPENYRAGEAFLEMPGRVHQSYVNLSKTEPAELLLFQVYKKGLTTQRAPAK